MMSLILLKWKKNLVHRRMTIYHSFLGNKKQLYDHTIRALHVVSYYVLNLYIPLLHAQEIVKERVPVTHDFDCLICFEVHY